MFDVRPALSNKWTSVFARLFTSISSHLAHPITSLIYQTQTSYLYIHIKLFTFSSYLYVAVINRNQSLLRNVIQAHTILLFRNSSFAIPSQTWETSAMSSQKNVFFNYDLGMHATWISTIIVPNLKRASINTFRNSYSIIL